MLIDLSPVGAAFEVGHVLEPQSLAPVVLEIRGSGVGAEPHVFYGQVRHTTSAPEGRARIGIEFVGITDRERDLLRLLIGLEEL